MNTLSDEILFGTIAGVQNLLNSGMDPNAQDEYGYTPLIEAVIEENLSLVKLLLANGATVHGEDILGCTPLQWAADSAHEVIVKFLLEKGADPNHYSAEGQPLLVNPILRNQHSLVNLLISFGAKKEFAQDYINAKLIGHRYELQGNADLVNTKGEFFEVDFEGFFLEFTLELIHNSLEAFYQLEVKKNPSSLWPAVQLAIQSLKNAAHIMQRKYSTNKNSENIDFKDLLTTNPLLIPVSFQGHAITLIHWGGLFAKCDRGVNKITDTVIIYQIKNPQLLTSEFIKDLLLDNKTDDFINTQLKTLLGLKPIMTLPTHSQIAGNCSWANVEAALPAIVMMSCLHQETTNRHNAAIKKQVMSLYGAWVEWDKDVALDACIKDFYEADRVRKAAKAAIVASIFVQRLHYQKPRQVVRAKKIAPILLLPEYQYIIKSYCAVYTTQRAGKMGENFLQLLKLCHMEAPLQSQKNTLRTHPEIAVQINMPLHIAARQGDLKTIKYYIENMHVNVNLLDGTESTALMYAAFKGHLHIVKYLVEQAQADIHLVNKQGGNAIKYAAFAQKIPVLHYLLMQQKAHLKL